MKNLFATFYLLFITTIVFSQAKQGYILSTVEFNFLKTGDSLWVKYDGVRLKNSTEFTAEIIQKMKRNDLVIVKTPTIVRGMVNVRTKTEEEAWIDQEHLRGRVISIPVFYEEPVEFYDKQLKEFPYSHHYVIYSLRGLAKTAAGDTTGAINDYSFAMSFQPIDFAYGLKANLHLARGEYDKAIKDYDDAIDFCIEDYKNPKISKLDVDLQGLNRDRGICHYYKKMYSQAISDFNESLAYNTLDEKCYYFRGLAYCKNGNTETGCADINKAKKLGYTHATEALKECKCN
ncbi:MAG: hypothetical protein JKY33_03950 [Bacteroidia bacterium]|nr:hypothetical protein [Bacteroidia bacterium]